MTKYLVNGSMVRLGSDLDMQVSDLLPLDTYVVSFSIELGFYLTRAPAFELPSKLYGNAETMSDRILNTFEDRPGTTGVLLSGVKGSGKSLTMKRTAIKALARGIPVLVVSSSYCGDGFNKFIQSIDQKCMVLFDEFEKVYDDADKQQALLTLFDGVYSTKKLFMLTANDVFRINAYMNNRPGRIYYAVEYRGLDAEFIIEYCNDVLKDKKYLTQIVTFASLFRDFNFDMLKALCEELNRYGEELKDALSVLNIKQDRDHVYYDVSVFVNNVKLKDDLVDDTVMSGIFNNPCLYLDVRLTEDGDYETLKLEPFADTTTRSQDLSRIEFNLNNCRVVLERQKTALPEYYRLM